MPDFTEFARHETVPVKFHDVSIQVTYDPSVLTVELLAEAEAYAAEQQRLTTQKKALERAGADTKAVPELRFLLAKAIKAWDLTEGSQPFPITARDLCRLPTEFLNRVSTTIRSNEAPKAESAGSLDDS